MRGYWAIRSLKSFYSLSPVLTSSLQNYKNLSYFSHLIWGAIIELLADLFYPTCLPLGVDSEFLKIMQHNAVYIVGAQ